MCIHGTSKPHGPYGCCCGCPLICGVLVIAALEVLTLISSVYAMDLVGIAFSSVVLIMFLLSFVKRHSHGVRYSLFLTYLASFILFLVYMIIYIATQDLTEYVNRLCNDINKASPWDWNHCQDDIENKIWVAVAIYAILVLSIRGYFARILYYYSKEAKTDKEYDELSGHNRDMRESLTHNENQHHQNNQQHHGNNGDGHHGKINEMH